MSALKNKFHPLEHDGVTYQVSFNMNVIDAINDEYGSTQNFIKCIEPEDDAGLSDAVIVIEEGAEESALTEKPEETSSFREKMKGLNFLMCAMINDAIEAEAYSVENDDGTPVKPYTVRSLQRSLLPADYMRLEDTLIDIMNAAYPQETPAKN